MTLIQEYQASFRERNAYLSQEFTSTLPDWNDAPYKHTVRRGVFEVPLPNGRLLAQHLTDTGPNPGLTLAALAQALWYANGVLRRKLDIDWIKAAGKVNRDSATHARGTASGGGLYPTELYLISDDLPGLPNGIYHHCEARSALQRTRAGRHGPALCTSWNGQARQGVCHLVLTSRLWKNVFKYKHFGYQVITEDCGAMLATLLQVLGDLGIAARVRFNFVDQVISDLMGLEEGTEVPMLVLEMGDGPPLVHPVRDAGTWRAPAPLERSQRVEIPALIQQLHRATMLDAPMPPASLPAWDDVQYNDWCALPTPMSVVSTSRLFMQRRSSMGRQLGEEAVSVEELATLLAAASAPFASDLAPAASAPRTVRLAAYAQHVDALPRGAYAYAPAQHALAACAGADATDADLQRIYYLQNYNIHQTGVLLAVVARHGEAHPAWGERSIRICNGEAGLIAQRVYMSASGLGLSCGAVLGFNCAEADALYGVDRPQESIVLMLLIARQPASHAAFDSQFDG